MLSLNRGGKDMNTMRTIYLRCLLGFVLCFLNVSHANSTELLSENHLVQAVGEYCYDGDTCKLLLLTSASKPDDLTGKLKQKLFGHSNVGLFHINYRISGIDCDERISKHWDPRLVQHQDEIQKYGMPAQKRMNELVKYKVIWMRQSTIGDYGRPVVELFVKEGGKFLNLGLQLVKEGYCEAYQGTPKSPPFWKKIIPFAKEPYIKAEGEAQRARLRRWSHPKYLSPYAYRRLKHLPIEDIRKFMRPFEERAQVKKDILAFLKKKKKESPKTTVASAAESKHKK